MTQLREERSWRELPADCVIRLPQFLPLEAQSAPTNPVSHSEDNHWILSHLVNASSNRYACMRPIPLANPPIKPHGRCLDLGSIACLGNWEWLRSEMSGASVCRNVMSGAT